MMSFTFIDNRYLSSTLPHSVYDICIIRKKLGRVQEMLNIFYSFMDDPHTNNRIARSLYKTILCTRYMRRRSILFLGNCLEHLFQQQQQQQKINLILYRKTTVFFSIEATLRRFLKKKCHINRFLLMIVSYFKMICEKGIFFVLL